jgi:hypothetical protein
MDEKLKKFLEQRIMDISMEIDYIEELPGEFQSPELWEKHGKLLFEHSKIVNKLQNE